MKKYPRKTEGEKVETGYRHSCAICGMEKIVPGRIFYHLCKVKSISQKRKAALKRKDCDCDKK